MPTRIAAEVCFKVKMKHTEASRYVIEALETRLSQFQTAFIVIKRVRKEFTRQTDIPEVKLNGMN